MPTLCIKGAHLTAHIVSCDCEKSTLPFIKLNTNIMSEYVNNDTKVLVIWTPYDHWSVSIIFIDEQAILLFKRRYHRRARGVTGKNIFNSLYIQNINSSFYLGMIGVYMLMCVMLMYSWKCFGPKPEKLVMGIFLLFNGNMLKSRDFRDWTNLIHESRD